MPATNGTKEFCFFFFWGGVSLMKLTFSHLKMDGWNIGFLLEPGLFSGAMLVSGSVSLMKHEAEKLTTQ